MAAFNQDIRFTRSADGTRLAYAVHGEGYPLVRAAHWLTNIGEDWQTPVFRPWFDELIESRNVTDDRALVLPSAYVEVVIDRR